MSRLTRGLTAKEWYIEGSELGIYPTISTTDDIRIHVVKTPTSLSGLQDTANSLLEDYEDGFLYYAAWKKAEKQAAGDPSDKGREKWAALAAHYKRLWEEVLKECTEEGGIQEMAVEHVLVDSGTYYTDND